jgi:2,4-dihydroxyhept-2-ene-1,7-dioic acid aldolase
MSLKLMYITNQPDIAQIAQKAGVDRIWIDLEKLGKEERQGHLNSVKSQHNIEDIAVIKPLMNYSKLLVRLNPINPNTKSEINSVVENGADIIMLPMFKTKEEVQFFVDCIGGRTRTLLLLETREAEQKIDEILSIDGIDEIHIGLNDLHLAYKMKFMFELVADGTVERLCEKFKVKGIPYGFGGIARLGKGDLPAEYVIAEHYRLGSSMAILSRSFFNTEAIQDTIKAAELFKTGIDEIRAYEARIANEDINFFEQNRVLVREKVMKIESNMLF